MFCLSLFQKCSSKLLSGDVTQIHGFNNCMSILGPLSQFLTLGSFSFLNFRPSFSFLVILPRGGISGCSVGSSTPPTNSQDRKFFSQTQSQWTDFSGLQVLPGLGLLHIQIPNHRLAKCFARGMHTKVKLNSVILLLFIHKKLAAHIF